MFSFRAYGIMIRQDGAVERCSLPSAWLSDAFSNITLSLGHFKIMAADQTKKFHYAWVICLCGLWLFVCNMGLCSNILSVYLPFIEAGGISDSMGSAIISVRCLFSFATTFLVEMYYRKLSLRLGILLASLLAALSAVVYSVGGSPFVYYTGAALGGVAYSLGSVFPVSLLIARWFHTNRGLAIGVTSAGSGVAVLIFSPLISALVLRTSLRAAFLVQAAFMFVSALCIFLLLRDDPAQKGLAPYGAGSEDTVKARGKEGPAELPKTVLWMLALMMLLIGGAGQAYVGHISVLAQNCGYTVGMATAAVSVHAVVLICSKSLSGGIADRIGTKRCSTIMLILFILGCATVQFMDGANLFWCFAPAVIMSLGSSVYNVGPPLWAADLADKAGYPRLLKWLQVFYNLGGIVFSTVPGIIADHTGEYKSSYALIACMMLASLLILRWSYRKANA